MTYVPLFSSEVLFGQQRLDSTDKNKGRRHLLVPATSNVSIQYRSEAACPTSVNPPSQRYSKVFG